MRGYFKLNEIAKCVMTSWLVKKAGYRIIFNTNKGSYVTITFKDKDWVLQDLAEYIINSKETLNWDVVEIKEVLEGELRDDNN